MMDKFLEAYMQWPATNQLALAMALLLAGSIAGLLGGYAVFVMVIELIKHLAVCVRGWPPVEEPVKKNAAPSANGVAERPTPEKAA